MKSLITTLVIGALFFGVSASVSWLFLFTPADSPTDEVAEVLEGDEHDFPPKIDESDQVDEMPVSLRPEMPISTEALTELAQSIMKKQKFIFDAEQRLKKEEKRLGLLFEDLRRERDELMAFSQRIDDKIIQAREATKLLQMETQSLEAQSNTLSKLERKMGKTTFDVEDDELDRRVKVVKNWFKNLEPEQAATYLKEFANRGDIDFAAKLLDSLEDRNIAKVLAAFNDAPLVAQIVDSVTKNKNPGSQEPRIMR